MFQVFPNGSDALVNTESIRPPVRVIVEGPVSILLNFSFEQSSLVYSLVSLYISYQMQVVFRTHRVRKYYKYLREEIRREVKDFVSLT